MFFLHVGRTNTSGALQLANCQPGAPYQTFKMMKLKEDVSGNPSFLIRSLAYPEDLPVCIDVDVS